MIDKIFNEILTICCEEFSVSVDEVRGPSRKQEYVYCRKAFSMVIREIYDVKQELIGRKINRSADHVSRLLSTQPDNRYYNSCVRRIKSRAASYS